MTPTRPPQRGQARTSGVKFTRPVTSTTGSIIAVLDDTCGNLIQLTQLTWGSAGSSYRLARRFEHSSRRGHVARAALEHRERLSCEVREWHLNGLPSALLSPVMTNW